jgi:hypothetical protein
MFFFRRLKVMWFTVRQARALQREGITDPVELRQLLVERVAQYASGGTLDFSRDDEATTATKMVLQRATNGAIDFGIADEDPVPSEAREFWEEYDPADEPAEITEQHLNLIRRMRFAWNNAEVGAPRLDSEQPYGSPYPLKDIADVFGKASVEELARRHADMTPVLNSFLQQARLEPGAYEVSGRTIQVTPDHRTLAKAFTFSWDKDALEDFEEGPWPGPSADPKRPYGNFTFFQREMALHLGWIDENSESNLSEDEIERLTIMHHEMLDAVKVIAAHGELVTSKVNIH